MVASVTNIAEWFMGLLSRAKTRLKRAVKTAAGMAKEQLDGARGSPGLGHVDQEVSSEGPTFQDGGVLGLEAWSAVEPLLEQLGQESCGLLQARLVDSELALRGTLDKLETIASSWPQASGWKAAAAAIADYWEEQNQLILDSWIASFERLSEAWTSQGMKNASSPWKQGWQGAARAFDEEWLREWEQLQAVLEDACERLKQRLEGISTHEGLSPQQPRAWHKALSCVDGGLRRVQGDLWGAWGTAGGDIRQCARKVVEEVGTPAEIYPIVFERIEADFAKAIRANVKDLRDSWIQAIDYLTVPSDASS